MSELADQIAFLSACLEGTDIGLLELSTKQGDIRLRRNGSGNIEAAGSAPTDILAPSVGVFRRCHALHTQPLAQAGQRVTAGDPVGLLQIGALLVHVTAPHDGIVLEVLADDGQAVGYGTALVCITGDTHP